MTHAIDTDALGRFAKRKASDEERLNILRHLLSGCEECSTHLRCILTPERLPAAYDAAIERASRRILRAGATEVEILFAELQAQPPGRRLLLCHRERFDRLELVQALIERSDRARSADPRAAVELASLAAHLCSIYPMPVDARVRSWSAVGNCWRLLGDHRQAEQWLGMATDLLSDISISIAVRLEAMTYSASLRFDQRRLDDSRAILGEVIALSRRHCNYHFEASGQLLMAIILGETGDHEAALRALLVASRTVDPADQRLALMIVHQMALAQAASGNPSLALQLLDAGARLHAIVVDETLQVKSIWLRGRITSQGPHPEDALPLLGAAAEALVRLGRLRDAILASIEHAECLCRLGYIAKARERATSALALAQRSGADREVLASLSLLAAAQSRSAMARVAASAISVVAAARLPYLA